MPRPELLETFENPYPKRDYVIFMESTEFTSLCPVEPTSDKPSAAMSHEQRSRTHPSLTTDGIRPRRMMLYPVGQLGSQTGRPADPTAATE